MHLCFRGMYACGGGRRPRQSLKVAAGALFPAPATNVMHAGRPPPQLCVMSGATSKVKAAAGAVSRRISVRPSRETADIVPREPLRWHTHTRRRHRGDRKVGRGRHSAAKRQASKLSSMLSLAPHISRLQTAATAMRADCLPRRPHPLFQRHGGRRDADAAAAARAHAKMPRRRPN